MKTNKYKIDLEIFIVFLIVIGISVFNAIFSTNNIARNQSSVNQIMETEIPSLQKLEEMRLLINQSVLYTTRWVYLPNSLEDKQKLDILQRIDFPNLRSAILRYSEKWKNPVLEKSIYATISGFEDLIQEQKIIMRQMSDFDDFENPEKHFKSEELLENTIVPHSKILISELNKAILQKQYQVDFLHASIEDSSRSMLLSIQGIAILIIIVIVIASFYVSKRMIIPIMKLKNKILQMGKGEIPIIEGLNEGNAVGLMTEAVQKLAESLRKTTQFAHKIGFGNLTAEFQPLSEKDELGNALLQMRNSLRIADDENKKRLAFSHFTEKINHALRENVENIDELSNQIISIMVKALNAYQGGIYLIDELEGHESNAIRLHGAYALEGVKKAKEFIDKEEGLIGQVIKDGEPIYLRNVNNGKKLIYSGFSSFAPSHVLIVPLKHQNQIYGAVEISGFADFKDFEVEFIKGIGETIGTTIANVKANTLTRQLLNATREQASKLAVQEEELRRTNNELSNQSNLLQASEEELKQSNLELKRKARELQQKNEINEQAREALIIKANELEVSNKYKSEFLANMSHELRTPLNSLLILARLLEENREKNLTPKQREYAGVIHKSGKNLLLLINDILDLSKIEAGKMQVIPESTIIKLVKDDIRMLFEELAVEKKITFQTFIDPTLPETFVSDKVRLEQIIKNLLSNAFKFTATGGRITFEIKRPNTNISFTNPNLRDNNSIIEFSVIDNGIGIAKEKQSLIFEAFQQADGSINRSYGGTGLGLSISKMLVGMLGGEMSLESEKGKGSKFYFHLPLDYLFNEGNDETEITVSNTTPTSYENVIVDSDIKTFDDRDTLEFGDKILLIVEDDIIFAHEILEKAHNNNFKGIIANTGEQGISYALKYKPTAIIIEGQLPDEQGGAVINEIKSDQSLSGIPLHVFETKDLNSHIGPSTFLRKPLDKKDLEEAFIAIEHSTENEVSRILLVEDAEIDNEIVRHLLASRFINIEIVSAKNTEEADAALKQSVFDFIVLDLDLGNGPEEGLSLLENLRKLEGYSKVPVVIFTGQELDSIMEERIALSSAIILSKNNSSFDKLIEETELFLHNVSEKEKSSSCIPFNFKDVLSGKKILIIDNDMRNIYSLSRYLSAQEMYVEVATDKKEVLEQLENHLHFDIILFDLHINGMDSLEVLSNFHSKYNQSPIIVLSSKYSMSERETVVLRGAADYILKPIDINQLYSLLRVWLYKE